MTGFIEGRRSMVTLWQIWGWDKETRVHLKSSMGLTPQLHKKDEKK